MLRQCNELATTETSIDEGAACRAETIEKDAAAMAAANASGEIWRMAASVTYEPLFQPLDEIQIRQRDAIAVDVAAAIRCNVNT